MTSEAERFDELFGRIDALAAAEPDGLPELEEPRPAATKLTPRLGETGLRFMVFKSEARSEASGRQLYSPTITVFIGQPGEWLHVKKDSATAEELAAAEDLFNRYQAEANKPGQNG